MFDFLNNKQPKKNTSKHTLKISGMHCSSCAITIDDALEEIDGVLSSNTNYAQSQTVVESTDEAHIEKIISVIKREGYSAELKLD